MKPFKVGSKIKHIRTGTYYTVVSAGKVNLPTGWFPCLTYQNAQGRMFTRAYGDFGGFILVE